MSVRRQLFSLYTYIVAPYVCVAAFLLFFLARGLEDSTQPTFVVLGARHGWNAMEKAAVCRRAARGLLFLGALGGGGILLTTPHLFWRRTATPCWCRVQRCLQARWRCVPMSRRVQSGVGVLVSWLGSLLAWCGLWKPSNRGGRSNLGTPLHSFAAGSSISRTPSSHKSSESFGSRRQLDRRPRRISSILQRENQKSFLVSFWNASGRQRSREHEPFRRAPTSSTDDWEKEEEESVEGERGETTTKEGRSTTRVQGYLNTVRIIPFPKPWGSVPSSGKKEKPFSHVGERHPLHHFSRSQTRMGRRNSTFMSSISTPSSWGAGRGSAHRYRTSDRSRPLRIYCEESAMEEEEEDEGKLFPGGYCSP